MDIKADISLQTKQVLSQVQMQSLNILSMTMTELQNFLQNEEIENPLVDYIPGSQEMGLPVVHREYDRFYNGSSRDEDEQPELYDPEDTSESVEDMITSQLAWNRLGEKERKVVEFCIHSLEESGYLTVSAEEVAKAAGVKTELAEQVLSELKMLEPKGIFASGLEECLEIQVRGMEQEDLLVKIIKNHLNDVAGGRISNISRALHLTSAEVRKLIHIIKGLNPKPLNGYGRERAQYILPDIILGYQDGQWTISLNDKWTGDVGINDFYVRMMEEAKDEELKAYFEEKLRRARFIVSAVEQRRKTLEGIAEGILKRQAGYLLGKEPLRPMILEEISEEVGIHKSTVSRAIRDKYILSPAGCCMIRDLFTSGIVSGNSEGEEVSRNTVKDKLRELVNGENKKRPYSDEQLAGLLKESGMPVSRRTVAKYRMELGIGGTFQRREE